MGDDEISERDAALGVALLEALDRMPVGVSILRYGPDGARRSYANQALADLVGTSRVELEAAQSFEFVQAGERGRVEALERAWLDGMAAPAVLETTMIAGDGRLIPVEARISTVDLGRERVAVALVTDRSDRKRIDEALRASEALFRQVAEAAPDAITVVVDGRFAFANPATARLLGHDPGADLTGTSLAEFLEPSEVAAMRERIQRSFAGELQAPREFRGRRRDGGTVLVEISSMPISFRGRPAVLAIGREVGERQRRQAEMVRAERMAAIGTLAAGVAHEINNPLTYVQLQLQRMRGLLVEVVPRQEHRDRLMAMIADAIDGSQRVAGIVRDLLWFSRGEAEARSPVVVADVVDTAIKLATSTLCQRAELVCAFEPVPPAAVAGPRLAQVVVNLLVNAAQAFERADPTLNRVDLRIFSEDQRVVLEVADNGPGFSDDLLPHVFDPFFTTKEAGTGLGLAISRSIIEEAGGSITAGHRPGGGARIRVELPAWHAERATTVPTADAPRPRVAIIDPDPELSGALGDWLEIDYDITRYHDAERALVELQFQPEIAIVVCATRAGELSGLELFRRLLAARPDYRGRFVLTGEASPEQLVQAAALGAEIVPRPTEPATVERMIARLVRAADAR